MTCDSFSAPNAILISALGWHACSRVVHASRVANTIAYVHMRLFVVAACLSPLLDCFMRIVHNLLVCLRVARLQTLPRMVEQFYRYSLVRCTFVQLVIDSNSICTLYLLDSVVRTL